MREYLRIMHARNLRFFKLTMNSYGFTVTSLGVHNAARAANAATPTMIVSSRPPLRVAKLVSAGGEGVSELTGVDAEGVTLEAEKVLLAATEDVAIGSTEDTTAEETATLLEEERGSGVVVDWISGTSDDEVAGSTGAQLSAVAVTVTMSTRCECLYFGGLHQLGGRMMEGREGGWMTYLPPGGRERGLNLL
ncbi:hypothetical protein I7I48_01423 [Histoplasma ohiense]|nr:hypothetical protein I7I48_01423 [Histoplasma ohiense (nom. inval.)]